MALTEGSINNYRPSGKPPKSVPLADGVKVFRGGIIMGLGAGYNAPANSVTPAGARVRGVALENVDNTAGSAGDKSVLIDNGGAQSKVFTNTQITQANVGDSVNINEDNSIYVSGAGTTAVLAGEIGEYISGTNMGTNACWITLKPEGVAS